MKIKTLGIERLAYCRYRNDVLLDSKRVLFITQSVEINDTFFSKNYKANRKIVLMIAFAST